MKISTVSSSMNILINDHHTDLKFSLVFFLLCNIIGSPVVSGTAISFQMEGFGGLEVRQITTFDKVWSTTQGGHESNSSAAVKFE